MAACTGSKPVSNQSAPAVEFKDTRWYLTAVHDTLKPGERVPYITFQTGSKVVGFGGCNTFFGGYSKNGTHLQMDHLASTEMFCEETQALEDAFLRTLNLVRTGRVEGNTLILGTREHPNAFQFATQQ